MTGEWPPLAGTGTPALSGSSRAVGPRRPLGPGVAGVGALEERAVVLEVADACGAEMLLIPLCSSAAGRAARAQLRLQTRLPARGRPRHLLGLVTARLPGRPVFGCDRPLPSGLCPFFLFRSGGTYGRVHGRADKCDRRHPRPCGAPRCASLCARPAPAVGVGKVNVSPSVADIYVVNLLPEVLYLGARFSHTAEAGHTTRRPANPFPSW